MKKLLFILSVFLIGCGYAPIDQRAWVIVSSIEVNEFNNQYCNYKGITRNSFTFSAEFLFVDEKNKFQIGDTIKFTK